MTDIFNVTKTEGHITILHFAGPLDRQNAGLVMECARSVKDSGVLFLLIDLSSVDVVTSAGLHALHGIFKIFTPHETMETWKKENKDEVFKSPDFKLSGASSQIQYLLNITGLLENIAIYPNVQEALDLFPS